MASEEVLRELSSMFGLLSDPTRLLMIMALAGGEELCVCDVANVVGLSISATSHQLRKLRDAGVVTFRNDGRMAYYRLADDFPVALVRRARARIDRGAA